MSKELSPIRENITEEERASLNVCISNTVCLIDIFCYKIL